MQTRRVLLAGGAGATLALGGLAYRAWDRGVWSGGEGPAYLPWSAWQGKAADGIKRPLRAAILASNPHDTQPWLFKIEENAITLFADRARNLGTFDPFRREMHLGLGAAIENLVLAARGFGLAAEVVPADGTLSLLPDDTIARAARVILTPMPATQDALFHAIPNRHTNRGPFERINRLMRTFCAASAISFRTTRCALSLLWTGKPAANSAGSLWKPPTALSAIHKCRPIAPAGSEQVGATLLLIATAWPLTLPVYRLLSLPCRSFFPT